MIQLHQSDEAGTTRLGERQGKHSAACSKVLAENTYSLIINMDSLDI